MKENKKNKGRSSNLEDLVIESKSFTFHDLLSLLLSYKKLNISIMFVSISLSILYCLITPSIYKASTLIVPTSGTQAKDAIDNIIDNFELAGTKKNNLNLESNLATLTSRQFIQGFIKEKNIIPIIIPSYKIMKNLQFIRFNKRNYEEIAYQSFLKSMAISSRGSLIEISLSLADREQVAPLTNQLIESLNQFIRNNVIEDTKRNINYIEESLNNSSLVNLQSTFYILIEEEIQKSMLANGNDEYAFTVLDIAYEPQHKSHPKIMQAVISSLIFGFIFCFFLVFSHSFYLQNFKSTGRKSNYE